MSKDIKVLRTKNNSKNLFVDIDFGTKQVKAEFKGNYIVLAGRYPINIKEKFKANLCYLLKKDGPLPIAFFSSSANRFYKLIPTRDWPSVSIGSVPMHRIKGISPKEDTENKIKLINPKGAVLDTCMGLGYTAIMASLVSKKVYTFEIDDNIYFIARLNPLSAQLFRRNNIVEKKGDVSELIHKFKDGFFDCIIHDPPTFKLAPVLYSQKFYREIRRVLKTKGRFFHYTPLYGIKRGKFFPDKVKMNLKESGFKIISFSPQKGGILCQKRGNKY